MSRFSRRVRVPPWSEATARHGGPWMMVAIITVQRWFPLLMLVSLASLWNGPNGPFSELSRHDYGSLPEAVSIPTSPTVRHVGPPLYSWDFSESMNESMNPPNTASNSIRVAENVPLKWDGIDFGSDLRAMKRLYHRAWNPPVWHRTNWTHAIFYHVFIPDNETTTLVALNLIKEQAGQMAYAAPSNVMTPVYYTLVGPKAAQYQAQVEQFFARYPSLSLHLLQGLKAGNEEVTLNMLRDYCVQQDVYHRTATRVTYVHNKGSFHPHKYNHVWRRALTAGALHPDCLQPLNPLSNACGLQFSTRFTAFFPGNMWTARCDYMAQLQPLQAHAPQTIHVLEKAMLMQLRQQVNMSYWPNQGADWFGIDLFVNEHWIGTHPDLVPTDVDPYCSLDRIYTAATRYAELVGTTATEPALRCRGFVWGPDVNQDILESLSTRTEDRYRDYFAFPALILRWFTFYGRGPPDTSPIWTWYSDGNVWKEAVREHGMAAASVVIDQFALPELGRTSRSAFSSRTATGSARLPKRLRKQSKEQHTIFFHVVLPLSVDHLYQAAIAALSNQLHLIAEALSVVSRNKIPIYYTLATRNATNMLGAKDVVQTICKAHALACIPLGDTVVDTDFAGETLWYAHQHCSANPTSTITYLNNVIPDQGSSPNTVGREQLILNITRGVLSKECRSETTCSTCGLKFSTIGMLHYKGNMYSARCDYINKLVPLVQFEQKMNRLAGMAMAAHTRELIDLGPSDVTASFFGIDQFAGEHWIGSHPSIVPCDLAGDGKATTFMEWSTHTDLGKDYQGLDTSMPHHQRLRWYSLLPGNLMKWDYLYDVTPANDSWIWREFPDGEHWKNSVQSHRLRLSTL